MTYQEMLREQESRRLQRGEPCAGLSDDLTISSQFISREERSYSLPGFLAGESRPIGAGEGQPDWLLFARKQLDAIASLPEGWDSYGAPSSDPRIVEAARGLIECLSHAPGLPQPHINPTRAGGVQFEWEAGARYFELEVVAERAAEFLYSEEDTGVEITGDIFEEESLDQVLACIYSVEGSPRRSC